jgi:hypothetical protein
VYQLGRPSDPGQAPFEALDRLSEAVALDRFEEAVAVVRQAISADPSGSLSHPLVKAWIARVVGQQIDARTDGFALLAFDAPERSRGLTAQGDRVHCAMLADS